MLVEAVRQAATWQLCLPSDIFCTPARCAPGGLPTSLLTACEAILPLAIGIEYCQ